MKQYDRWLCLRLMWKCFQMRCLQNATGHKCLASFQTWTLQLAKAWAESANEIPRLWISLKPLCQQIARHATAWKLQVLHIKNQQSTSQPFEGGSHHTEPVMFSSRWRCLKFTESRAVVIGCICTCQTGQCWDQDTHIAPREDFGWLSKYLGKVKFQCLAGRGCRAVTKGASAHVRHLPRDTEIQLQDLARQCCITFLQDWIGLTLSESAMNNDATGDLWKSMVILEHI